MLYTENGLAVVQLTASFASGCEWIVRNGAAPTGKVVATRAAIFGRAEWTLSGFVRRFVFSPIFESSIPDSVGIPFDDRDGKWAVENEGVAPDIDVENWPKDAAAGHDMQLEAAVKEGLAQLKAHPVDRATKEPAAPEWGKRKPPM